MNPISRGIRNTFRNPVRTISIVVILGISLGLSLTMLIAHQAVGEKISQVKSSVGNTINISPAGFNPGSQANNALTTTALNKVKSLAHVNSLTETLTDRLSTTGSDTSSFGRFGASSDNSSATTSLKSPTTINLNSNSDNGGRHFFVSGGDSGNLPTSFTPPITFLGTNDPDSVDGSAITIKSGKTIDGTATAYDALISSSMASKNSLKVGSTFTAYDQKITVAGVFTSSNQSVDDTVVLSLPALQKLNGQSGVVTSAVATVDSLDNLSSATSAIKKSLGDNADVTSALTQADDTVKPLENVRNISTISLIGAGVAGAIIILLTMIMIVRERKREIGILKAIGASNRRVIAQFMSEAITFTLIAAIVGIIIGVAAGSPITNTLVSNSSSSGNNQQAPSPGNASFGARFDSNDGGSATSRDNFSRPTGGFFQRGGGSLRNTFTNINVNVGWSILAYGFAGAIIIALIGSVLAGGLIARIRPSEVMRPE